MKQRRNHLARAALVFLLGTALSGQALAQEESVADWMAGRFAGVQVLPDDGAPGASFSVRIRGLRSFRGDTTPLYVLDGIILNAPSADAGRTFWSDAEDQQALQSMLDHINPADIERVEILKDADAIARYGSMGGNGVVIITTRHGQSDGRDIQWKSALSVTDGLALSHRHHVSFAGGEKRSGYYVSAGYNSQRGNLKGSALETASALAKFDQGFGRDSRFGMSLALGLRNNSMVMATSPWGSNSMVKAAWKVSPLPSEAPSVWADAYDDNSTQYSVSPHMEADFGLGAGFRFKADAGMDFRSKTRYRWVGADLARAAAVRGEAGQSNTAAVRYSAQAFLSWEREANGHHAHIAFGGGVFGTSFREYIYEGTTFFSQLLRAPGISIAEKVAPYRHLQESQLNAFISTQIQYNYKERYFAGLGFRTERQLGYDSIFGQTDVYPSVRVAWDIAKEDFFPEGLQTLKIHYDYGWNGTHELLPYGYDPYYIFSADPALPADELANYYHLRWRNLTRQHDLGLEAGLPDGRLDFGLTLYQMRSADEVRYLRQVPSEEPQKVFSDEGGVLNKGVEVSVKGLPVKKENLRWSIGAVVAYNHNEILSTGSGEDIFGHSVGVLGGNPLIVTVARPGEPVGSFYGYKSQGTLGPEHTLLSPAFQGNRLREGDVKFIDQDGDGNVTEADRTVIGSPLPSVVAGLESELKVGGFTASVVLDGAFGFQVVRLEKFLTDPSVDLAAARGVEVFSSRLLEDGSYVRLANLSLGYELPLRRMPWIKSLSVTLAARNLLTLTRFSGSAPFVNSYGLDVTRLGIDNGAYPACRSFLLGLTLRF